MHQFKLLLLAMIMTVATFTASIQAKGPDPERQLEHLNDTLLLSPEQSEKVASILQDTHAKRAQLIEEQKPQREAMRQSMQSLHESTRTQMSAILNPQQLAKFDSMHEKHMNKMKGNQSGNMGGQQEGGKGSHHGRMNCDRDSYTDE
jgi:Spy/CpxP family protein refolding chaperone